MKYIVKSGDTLYKIALRHGITLDALIAANPDIENPDVIHIGQVINIPVVKIPVTPPDVTPCPDLPLEEGGFPIQEPGGVCPPVMPDMGGVCPPIMPDMGGMYPPIMPDMGGMYPPIMPDMGGMCPPMMPDMGSMMPGVEYGIMPDEYGCFFVIQQGDKGCHVRCVQECLKHMGYYHGSCNGRFGSQTKCAVMKYQRDCGMAETGIVDLLVLTALGLF